MATSKITIALPDVQLYEIRALVDAGKAANISEFVRHAICVALSDAAGWKDMLDGALEHTGGPLTAKERVWADKILDSPARNLRKKA